MYCTNGTINDVLRWFNHKNNPYDWLFFLVAGHLNDAKLFQEFFKHKESLHVISGHQIALVIFCNNMDMATGFQAGATGYVLPVNIIDAGYPANMRLFAIDNLPSELKKEDIINSSKSIANEICRYFVIPTNQLPGILIFQKWFYHPILIRTKGASDLKNLVALLKELQEATDYEPIKIEEETRRIELHLKIEDQIKSDQNRRAETYINRAAGYERECKNLVRKISNSLLSKGALEEDVKKIFSLENPSGIDKAINKSIVDDSKMILNGKEIIITPKISKLCKILIHMSAKLQKAREEIEVIKRNKHRPSYISIDEIKKLKVENDQVVPEIMRLAQKYERKFTIQNSMS